MAVLTPLQPALDADKVGSVAPLTTDDVPSSGTAKPSGEEEGTSTGLQDSQISSPHELTDWVDNVLDSLESRFTTMSAQVESRMKEMSERIDALESSIEELITGAVAPVSSSSTTSAVGVGRSSSNTSRDMDPHGPQVRIHDA